MRSIGIFVLLSSMLATLAFSFTIQTTTYAVDNATTSQIAPALIDGSWAFQENLTKYGTALAVSGDWLFVGNFGSSEFQSSGGAVYIYNWNGANWVEYQIIGSSDMSAGDHFGDTVVVQGDWLFVGASDDGQGSAYVFHWDGANWVEEQKLTANDGLGDGFGSNLAVQGDWLFVASLNNSSIYVFNWNGAQWINYEKLTASADDPLSKLGQGLAIEGDWLLASAPREDAEGLVNSGSAYLFHWDGVNWVEYQRLIASDIQQYLVFGGAVALSPDTVVIGSEGSTTGPLEGSVYIFHWNGANWVEDQKILGTQHDRYDFGSTLAIQNDTLYIGAPTYSTEVLTTGVVYVFHWDGGQWVESSQLVALDRQKGDRFGRSLATDGLSVVVGQSTKIYVFGTDRPGISNDDFADALELFSRDTQSIYHATLHPDDPPLSCSADYTQSVWYKIYRSAGNPPVVVETQGSLYDTVIGVFVEDGPSLQEIACSDDEFEDSTASRVIIEPQDEWYYIMVAHASVDPILLNEDGLALSANPVGPNDEASSASTISFTSFPTHTQISKIMRYATFNPEDPVLSCANAYAQSVWFEYVPSVQYPYTHWTFLLEETTNFDSVVAVFIESNGEINEVSCSIGSPNTPLPVFGTTESGQTYKIMVGHLGSQPTNFAHDRLDIYFERELVEEGPNDALVLFNPTNSATDLFHDLFLFPNTTSHVNTPPTNNNNIWLMGDWNGDGLETPGYFSQGIFRYTNALAPTIYWSDGIWLGNPPSRAGVVAGRFDNGFANDCIGWVDSSVSQITGDLRFSLKWWCDMTASGAVPLATQWLGAPLGDSQGFSGTHQFIMGDWDGDAITEIAVRRENRIAYTLANPNTAATFPQAQRWDRSDSLGPGGHAIDNGLFVAGDWDGDGTDGWGVVYDDNEFYYRNDLSWNPGPWHFMYQAFATDIMSSRQVVSHNTAWGGSGVAAPHLPDENSIDIFATELNGSMDASQNVESELSVSKAGNYNVGEVGLMGDSIVWTITVSNTGTAPANGVQITDNIPTELRVDDALSDNGTITVRGQAVIFTAESIGVGETARFQVVTTILSQPESGTFANSVNVVLPDGNGNGSDANLVASGTVQGIDGLPATGYAPKFRW